LRSWGHLLAQSRVARCLPRGCQHLLPATAVERELIADLLRSSLLVTPLVVLTSSTKRGPFSEGHTQLTPRLCLHCLAPHHASSAAPRTYIRLDSPYSPYNSSIMAAKTARASSAASFTYAPTRAEIHEAGKTYGQQQQPPYQGPPPVPQGWNVNPSQWNSGYWQYNPNFQPAGAPPVQQMPNPTSWMPDPRWVPQYPPQQQQQQPQQQEQQNPFKRPIKPPSAEYMATKISENGLGLFGMEPVYVLYFRQIFFIYL